MTTGSYLADTIPIHGLQPACIRHIATRPSRIAESRRPHKLNSERAAAQQLHYIRARRNTAPAHASKRVLKQLTDHQKHVTKTTKNKTVNKMCNK